ncbi:recombinase family protein, partial [Salmonella enterica subsp. enterica serovar Virchow]|nr:recombinase family protein [Salmonella enterica subsp. enterica serovar Virchow]
REHIAELNKRITDAEQRLHRLYDAIETGIADLNDAALKDRVAGLTAIRDQAKVDVERAQAALDNSTNRSITPEMVGALAEEARKRIRLPDGGYRRDHLRSLAQRVEVADKEVRIMGSRAELLQALTASSGVESAKIGVPSSVLKWRTRQDSNL